MWKVGGHPHGVHQCACVDSLKSPASYGLVVAFESRNAAVGLDSG